MKSARKIGLTVVLLVPALTYGAKIQNDYDLGVDFLNYTTYAWQEGTRSSQAGVHERILHAVDSVLTHKYLRRIQANPDLNVTYHASTTDELNIDISRYGYTYGPRWQWGGGMGKTKTSSQRYPKETLVIDLWEAKSRRLIWRGVATGALSPDPAKNAEKIAKAVQEMFKSFPPRTEQR